MCLDQLEPKRNNMLPVYDWLTPTCMQHKVEGPPLEISDACVAVLVCMTRTKDALVVPDGGVHDKD